jgi:hypothetical protein
MTDTTARDSAAPVACNGAASAVAMRLDPPGRHVATGDIQDNFEDSRYPEAIGVGYVPEENLVVKAEIILFSSKGGGFRPDRVFKTLH